MLDTESRPRALAEVNCFIKGVQTDDSPGHIEAAVVGARSKRLLYPYMLYSSQEEIATLQSTTPIRFGRVTITRLYVSGQTMDAITAAL